MTMMPNIKTLTEIDLAINADTGQWIKASRAEVTSLPIWGFANGPEAEMKLLRADMEECFLQVRGLLGRYQLTLEQELEVYNRVPLGKTASEIPEEQLIAFIQGVCHD
jgi:hypothetical protein